MEYDDPFFSVIPQPVDFFPLFFVLTETPPEPHRSTQPARGEARSLSRTPMPDGVHAIRAFKKLAMNEVAVEDPCRIDCDSCLPHCLSLPSNRNDEEVYLSLCLFFDCLLSVCLTFDLLYVQMTTICTTMRSIDPAIDCEKTSNRSTVNLYSKVRPLAGGETKWIRAARRLSSRGT